MKEIHKQYFFKILKKYRLGKASEKEIKFLETYYNVFEVNEDFLTNENRQDAVQVRVKHNIDKEIAEYESASKRKKLSRLLQRYSAAAAILIVVSLGTYFLIKKHNAAERRFVAGKNIAPGGNKAVLTLANGKKISLDDAGKGVIAQQPGIRITKTADGQIVYTVLAQNEEKNKKENALLNAISTPKGGQYQVTLPDKTKVWLNSVSSLRYPTSFTGGQRLVELSGEAYFEVAKNKDMPFRIKTILQTIEVLGTHFNVNAYDDEPLLKTTLLEGSVKISTTKNQTLLVPGQQALVKRLNAETVVENNVNIDKIVAWKNGIFSFENDDLKSIMRQIARWYGVTVVYDGPVSDEKFFGEISRSSDLSQVFKILELNNVHFDAVGKTVRVSGGPASRPK